MAHIFVEKGTTTQLQAFEDEFRKLWNAPPTPNEHPAIEVTNSGYNLAPDAVPRQMKSSIATSASKTIRRIVNMCSSLCYSTLTIFPSHSSA
jgi:hypothetical protein